MRAKDFVPAGGSSQVMAGEMFFPTHEYLAGMDCPFANASLVNVRDMVASVAGISVAAVSDAGMDVAEDLGVLVADDVQDTRMIDVKIKLIKRICLIPSFLFSLHGTL
jgi:hypothetical protein